MNWSQLLFVVFILGAYTNAAAKPDGRDTGSRDDAGKENSLEIFLIQCITEFLTEMANGIPNLNIPAFDPWYANGTNFPFRMTNNAIALRADANATDVTSIGFSSLQVISADLDVNTGLYNISMALTDLQVEGIYSLTGSHHLIYPIIGTGPFDITLYGVSTSGTSKLYIKDDVFQLEAMDLEPLSYNSASGMYDNLSILGAGDFPGVVDTITQQLTHQLWQQVEEELGKQLSDSIVDYLNEELLDFLPTVQRAL